MAALFGIDIDFDEQHFPIDKFGIGEVYQLDNFDQFIELLVDLLNQFFIAISDERQAGNGFILRRGSLG